MPKIVDHAARRDEIALVACRVVAEHGFENATIVRIAREAGMALEGPNCLGMVNFIDGVCLTFGVAQPRPVKGPGLAIASQSGAMATVLRAALHARDIDVTFTVSTGNEALNGLEDFLTFLVEEPNTRAIAPGAVMSCRIVGVLMMEDQAGIDEKLLKILAREVLSQIQTGNPAWENVVPAPAVAVIKLRGLFGHTTDPGEQV